MSRLQRTERGFVTTRVAVRSCHQEFAAVRLTESSSVGTHPHIWLFVDGECREHLGHHQRPGVHLSLANAKRLVAQLTEIIDELSR